MLLVNKEHADGAPVVVQVPPPKEVTQAMQAMQDTTSEEGGGDESANNSRKRLRKASPTNVNAAKKSKLLDSKEDSEVSGIMQQTELSSGIPELEELISTESKFGIISIMNGKLNVIDVLVFGPLMRLSPPPSEKDYCFNLDVNEGVCDLFDVL